MAAAGWSVALVLIGLLLVLIARGEPPIAVLGWASVILGLLLATLAVLFDESPRFGGGRVG